MPAASSSIEQLLALARQRRLWPEVEAKTSIATPEQSPQLTLSRLSGAKTELTLLIEELASEAARALGPKLGAAQPLLDQLSELLTTEDNIDLDAAWAAMDELEDQLEALSR
jgi:hypothetical protein